MGDRVYVGIDIGSVSINIALVELHSPSGNGIRIINDWYVMIEGKPLEKAHDILSQILQDRTYNVQGIAATGSGGRLLAELLCIPFVNEVIAQAQATGYLYPEVRTIIEIGGEDSKFISIDYDKKLGTHVIRDFAMNTICAAGTGAFLDQQAARLGLSIEEFAKMGLKCEKPPRIAGRCSVFANTDMIHLQQEGTPVEDIVAGLCFALARNFKSVIAKGKKFTPPVSFQGGVALNKGMVRAFRETLGLNSDEFIIPKWTASMGAIGCVLEIRDSGVRIQNLDLEKIHEFLVTRTEIRVDKPLKRLPAIDNEIVQPKTLTPITDHRIPVWLGIDVGSISTNLVLIDSNKKLVAREYLWTSGRPIDVVMQGLKKIGAEFADKVEVKGVGTTGSGRYMIGDLVGADVVKNEITSQARAAIEIDPSVDTIFEIGGQDSKYISLKDGVIVDFEMNKVCAAGTGSFLEEQAERLNLNVCKDFANCAFQGTAPINLGERCTVFMQSNLTAWQQKGAKREDLSAGLAYSIAYNYLNRVVRDKKIGNNIFFQGAVALNKAIVAAFCELLGKPVRVPPNNDVTGAIGVAIIAQENSKLNPQNSKFKGFNLYERKYNIDRFECRGCPNYCEIKKVMVEDEEPLYYGSRCDKYEKKVKVKSGDSTVDLFQVREELLLKSYHSQLAAQASRPVVGIPRALLFHEYLPFWVTFFHEIGCNVALSTTTNNKIIHSGIEHAVAEHCFPIKATHGHILELIEKGVDYIFLPSVIDMPTEYHGIEFSYTCPYEQAVPYVIKSALANQLHRIKLILPVLYLKRGKKHIEEVLTKEVGNTLGISKSKVKHAVETAFDAQSEFYNSIKAKGREVLPEVGEVGIVIVGRPYNTCDTGLNLNIPRILNDLGVPAIPMDFLDVGSVEIGKDWPNMYWKYGQQILSASRIIKSNPNLYSLYITNFGCGPDSFIQRYFEYELGDKPLLVIEVDEHSAPAGVITRVEAFLDSIYNSIYNRIRKKGDKEVVEHKENKMSGYGKNEDCRGRKLFIPFMGHHSYAFAAAFRHYNIDAEVIPVADADTLEFGRKYTTGKECYPCILTTGDMIKILKSGKFDPSEVAFFMPEASGPCRFGQYNKLHRLILKELGYDNVPIFSPNQAKNMYKTVQLYGKDFDKRAWFGMCTVDLLDKLVRSVRPYEVNKGEADRVYKKGLDLICNAIEGNGDIWKVMRDVTAQFAEITVNREPKPLIGITGEIYIRSHHFANDNIVRAIEDLGGEVSVSTITEWFFYVNYRRKEDSIVNKKYKELIMYWLKDKWQEWIEHKFIHSSKARRLTPLVDEPKNEELLRYSNPYLHRTVEGEAVLTVGKCIDFIKRGADGIITVMPFTCMPGTNVVAVMERVKEKYGIPYLNVAYDGLEQSTTQTRLEAFMHQAHQYKKSKKN